MPKKVVLLCGFDNQFDVTICGSIEMALVMACDILVAGREFCTFEILKEGCLEEFKQAIHEIVGELNNGEISSADAYIQACSLDFYEELQVEDDSVEMICNENH